MEENSSPTLFDRVGGEEAVAALVTSFYDNVLADEELAPFFKHVPMDKLKHMQREFFAAALDGPVAYNGRPFSEVHAGRGIQPKHLKRFVDHLVATLKDSAIEERDVYDIISRINTYADDITSAGSGLDG
jgi:hemoglobin